MQWKMKAINDYQNVIISYVDDKIISSSFASFLTEPDEVMMNWCLMMADDCL